MKRVGLVPHPGKPAALQAARELVGELRNRGCEVWIEANGARKLGREAVARQLDEAGQTDFIIVLGGDGTLLTTARSIARLGVPILGINFGHMGFLTELEVHELGPNLDRLLAGDFSLDDRMMLRAKVIGRDGTVKETSLALNDVVLTRGVFARIAQVQVRINDYPASRYNADGVIVATPTGSTAYSLSAGGPIVHPQLETILITPICPHSLASRSILIRGDETVSLELISAHDEVMLTVDGQLGWHLEPEDRVEIVRARHRTRLIRMKGRNFYEVVHSRFA